MGCDVDVVQSGLRRWLDLSVIQQFPIDSTEERVLLDLLVTLKSKT